MALGAPTMPESRMSEMLARAPAATHTKVDTALGLMPDSRARSGLSAAALTVRPKVVRLRNHASARVTRGTTTRTVSWGPVTRTPATSSHTVPTATGKRASRPVRRSG
jgi:hypothetical protein